MPFSELYFNVDNGYLEGLVRGFKAGILSQADYLNLVQCETLEGEFNVITVRYPCKLTSRTLDVILYSMAS